MSIERFDRLKRVGSDPATGDMPTNPLIKSNSVGSNSSNDLLSNSLDNGGESTSEMLENLKNSNNLRKHSIIHEEEDEPPLNEKVLSVSQSDPGLTSRYTGNGQAGSGLGVGHGITEEQPEVAANGGNAINAANGGNAINAANEAGPKDNEIALDPTRLEEGCYPSVGGAGKETPESPFNKKAGAIKKVSFFAGGDGDEDGEDVNPVSDTYHYEEAKKSKWKLFKK